MAKAIAFATAHHTQPSPVGPQRPGQRPPRLWRALLARRGGRRPLTFRAAPSLAEPSHAGGARQCLASSRPLSVGCVFTRTIPASMAKAIAFATVVHRQPSPVGPQRPGQRPPRPRRALFARPVGRWPLVSRAGPSLLDPSPAGGGEAVTRLFPPGRGCALASGMRFHTYYLFGIHGEGHRLRHRAPSAALTGRASKARPAPAPPMAGASRPPGRALASGISCRAVSA